MPSWRDLILNDFQEPIPALTLVVDPDDLLADEVLAYELKKRDIRWLEYGDPVAFRCLFEHFYPEIRQGTVRLLVVVEGTQEDVPYDVQLAGRWLTYRLTDLFPALDPVVVRQLDGVAREALYQEQPRFLSRLGQGETCDFILRKVYKVAFETIDGEAEFFKYLLSLHYSQREYPDVVKQYLIEQLERNPHLNHLPVRELISSRPFFYRYLQKEWEVFLNRLSNSACSLVRETPSFVERDEKHPFEDADVRRLLDNLFLEGRLTPVQGVNAVLLPEWTHVGLVVDRLGDEKKRLLEMAERLEERAKDAKQYWQWLDLAPSYAEMKHLFLSLQVEFSGELEPSLGERVKTLEEEMDTRFAGWLVSHFGALASLPYLPKPVMLHHIPHFIAARSSDKVALVVLDGMGFVQWVQMRHFLLQREKGYVFEEQAVFAWVPTITSISRQALFGGEMPLYFPHTLHTTGREEKAWRLFWENRGVLSLYTTYVKGLGQGETTSFTQFLAPSTRVAGLVVDVTDKLTHRALLGHRGLYAELKIWLEKGFLFQLLEELLATGYALYITSDHGNKACRGIGRLTEGVLAETQGERVRLYRDRRLRDLAAERYPSITWPGDGLPPEVYALLARSGEAFVREGESVISHGGISVEEVLVPFVRVTKLE